VSTHPSAARVSLAQRAVRLQKVFVVDELPRATRGLVCGREHKVQKPGVALTPGGAA
jgi:hypothetical protein